MGSAKYRHSSCLYTAQGGGEGKLNLNQGFCASRVMRRRSDVKLAPHRGPCVCFGPSPSGFSHASLGFLLLDTSDTYGICPTPVRAQLETSSNKFRRLMCGRSVTHAKRIEKWVVLLFFSLGTSRCGDDAVRSRQCMTPFAVLAQSVMKVMTVAVSYPCVVFANFRDDERPLT